MESKDAQEFINATIREAFKGIQEKGISVSDLRIGRHYTLSDGSYICVTVEYEVGFDGAFFKGGVEI